MELNGVAVTVDQIKTLALTNYGHFTSMTVDRQRAKGLSLHMERLRRDCLALFDQELDTDRVRYYVRRATADVQGPVMVRATVFDPGLQLGNPGADAEPQVLVTTRPAAGHAMPALRVRSVRYQREMPMVKHVGLLSPLFHRRGAQRAGFDDVLFVDDAGCISEGSTWNVGFFDGERVIWPEAKVLPGVTIALLREHSSVPMTSRRVRLEELGAMQAAFATNASVGVRCIAAIDDCQWKDLHPILRTLADHYESVPREAL